MVKKIDKADSHGFTLLELLVAMVIFGIIMLTLFLSFNSFLSSGNRIKNEVIRSQRIQFGMRTIVSDLNNLFILQFPRYHKPEFDSEPDLYRFVGDHSDSGGGRFSRLDFSSLNHLGLGADPGKGVAQIVYYVHKHGTLFDLHRSDRLLPYPEEVDPCSDPILFKDIAGFKLIYTDVKGDEYDTWDSESKDTDYIFPARVDIRIELKRKTGVQVIETAVILPVNRENME
ncbi:MAG: prepilin-type N-terminal cleavage/methylation domain-containing protein [Desulfobacteraceae bacterium]|nr:prepilin-type N-terminal cleavage/methylation domain-containing protein [Desulfobacteraceae bacterium]